MRRLADAVGPLGLLAGGMGVSVGVYSVVNAYVATNLSTRLLPAPVDARVPLPPAAALPPSIADKESYPGSNAARHQSN